MTAAYGDRLTPAEVADHLCHLELLEPGRVHFHQRISSFAEAVCRR